MKPRDSDRGTMMGAVVALILASALAIPMAQLWIASRPGGELPESILEDARSSDGSPIARATGDFAARLVWRRRDAVREKGRIIAAALVTRFSRSAGAMLGGVAMLVGGVLAGLAWRERGRIHPSWSSPLAGWAAKRCGLLVLLVALLISALGLGIAFKVVDAMTVGAWAISSSAAALFIGNLPLRL